MGTMENEYMQSETQLEQAMALNQILLETLEADRKDRRKTRRISIICAAVCMVSLLLFAAVLGVLAAGIQIETATEESTVTQETSGEGDAVYQAGDGSHYYAGGDA